MGDCTYTVVENAGYVGECDIARRFPSARDAWRYVESHYDSDERETLHVDVRRDFANGDQTYDY